LFSLRPQKTLLYPPPRVHRDHGSLRLPGDR
jgi:hypothetical protein